MKIFFKNKSNFRNVFVKGEVSGAKISTRGHLYFNLKDKRSIVPCVIFKSIRQNIEFEVKDGMKLLLIANVVIYEPHGKYQLDIREISEDGLGRLYVKFQQLKEKLTNEGLFNILLFHNIRPINNKQSLKMIEFIKSHIDLLNDLILKKMILSCKLTNKQIDKLKAYKVLSSI